MGAFSHGGNGLGATLDQLRGVCRNDPEALDAIDRATQNAPSIHVAAVDNVHGTEDRPSGNTSARALRRLRKDRPDLHGRVLAGDLTPHAAAIEAGFRPKTLTVPLTVEGFARAITKHLSAGQRAGARTGRGRSGQVTGGIVRIGGFRSDSCS